MNEHCNIFEAILCIIENGISSGTHVISDGIRERVGAYIQDRGFTVDNHMKLMVVLDDEGEIVLSMIWEECLLRLDTKNYNHHIVLETIVVASELIIREVMGDDEKNELDKSVDHSDVEEDSIDEWI